METFRFPRTQQQTNPMASRRQLPLQSRCRRSGISPLSRCEYFLPRGSGEPCAGVTILAGRTHDSFSVNIPPDTKSGIALFVCAFWYPVMTTALGHLYLLIFLRVPRSRPLLHTGLVGAMCRPYTRQLTFCRFSGTEPMPHGPCCGDHGMLLVGSSMSSISRSAGFLTAACQRTTDTEKTVQNGRC